VAATPAVQMPNNVAKSLLDAGSLPFATFRVYMMMVSKEARRSNYLRKVLLFRQNK